jgi:drug/metabolite transporter (DMT)-like permease
MNRTADIKLPLQELPVAAPVAARDWLTPVELTALAAIWGASFLFQRVSAPHFGALALAEVRLFLGAVVLLPFLWRDRAWFTRQRWPSIALIGAINSTIPFALFAWASQHAPAGVVAITNSTAVLFTALIGFLVWGERISTRQGMGLFAGFAGVVVLAAAKTAGVTSPWAVAAGTGAAVLYGIGVNLVRRRLDGAPPIALASATLACAALLLLPFALLAWPKEAIPAQSWFCAIALGVFCSGVAYALYYRLIQRVGGTRAVTVTYLVPVFAVAWAWMLLGERPTWPMAIAGALILGSVALSQARR